MKSEYDQILSKVNKPSQYIGSEINSIQKDPGGIKVSIALAFPELYELGMSHLGLGILYHILNSKSEIRAERVFAPEHDYAMELKRLGLPLASLESNIPLNSFDLVGFSLQYELTYTNILYMLNLGHIPINSHERTEKHPFVAGGGPCAFNPEPLVDFFDFFIIGDGEEAVPEVVKAVGAARENGLARQETIGELSMIDGVYAPSFFDVSYHENGSIREISPRNKAIPHVRKRLVHDLNQVDYPTKPVVSFTQLVHDRLALEIDRGCTQGCRFCQAGTIYRPVRERSFEKIENLLDSSLSATGYEEISLLSLSSGDYSGINTLVPYLLKKYEDKKIALSLPSLRPGTIDRKLMEAIESVRKTGFTISVEAGSVRLRNLLNKNVTEENVLETVSGLADFGWEHLKLYFMIGLPTETEEDIREIVNFCLRVLKTANKNRKQIKSVNLGIGIFVPKAHTPFQWAPQEDPGSLSKKIDLLFSLFKRNRVFNFKKPKPQASFLEAVFAKGDRRLGKVIQKAFDLGCRFDGWGERFRYDLWQKAFEECGVDPGFYAHRTILRDELLPWSHIKTGVSEDFLRKEYAKAFQGTLTPDCRAGKCQLCGMETECKKVLAVDQGADIPPAALARAGKAPYLQSTVRIRFKKAGDMKYISHLDLNRLVYRACQRARLPLAFSQGFHPHPKISYASALSLGVESLAEYAEIQFQRIIDPGMVMEGLNAVLPMGVEVLSAERLPPVSAPLVNSITKINYEITIRANERDTDLFAQRNELEEAVKKVLEARELIIERTRKGKLKKIDLSPFIDKLEILDFSGNNIILLLTLLAMDSRQVQPRDVLGALFAPKGLEGVEVNVLKKDVCMKG